MKRLLLAAASAAVLCLAISVPALAADITVNPGESIQAAIDVAAPGDTVRVAAGAYNESITLKDGVTVQGAGAEITTISGEAGSDPPAAVRAIDVGPSTRIDGFTIVDTYAGIWNQRSSTVITNNIIAGGEGGIANFESSPTIDSNVIVGGSDHNDGINSVRIYSDYAAPTITNNIIVSNGLNGIWSYNCSGTIANNVISNNGNCGIKVHGGSLLITNNTIIGNSSCGISQDDSDSSLITTNNIISGSDVGLYRVIGSPSTNQIDFNDVYGNTSDYLNCSAGANDISAAPDFVAGSYHLRATSPCIDAGTNGASGLPSTDFEGDTRVLDGNGDGSAIVDIGADEYRNLPPTADAGDDQTVEQTSPAGAMVTLDGSGSSDPEGAPLTYAWTWDGGSATGINPTVMLPQGTTTVTLVAHDGMADSAPDTVDITVQDTTAPEISVSVTPRVPWSPNHKMVAITARVTVTDICDPGVDVVLTSITSNEPDDAVDNGDGNTVDDIQGASFGAEDYGFLLRAERAGAGTGRVYTIIYTATDASGNSANGVATVAVPR